MSIALIDQSTSAPRKSKSRIKNPQRPPRARKSSLPNSRLPHSPISSKKLIANRKNAQKSTGPRTPSGKSNSSQNALKHSLCSQSPRLPNECSATYNLFVQEMRESLRPTHPLQKELFHQICSILWRLQRANETENQLYALRQKNNDPPCLTLAREFHKNPTSNPFLLYSRYERHLRNTYLRLIAELKKIQKEDAAATDHFRRTEPAWSPEKHAAQIAAFAAQSQPQPQPDESDVDEDYQERWSAPSSTKIEQAESMADTDWYKEMMQRRRDRDQQRRLESHRKENERIEQAAATSPSPSSSLDVERSTLDVERSPAPTENEATASHPLHPQIPPTPSEPPLSLPTPSNNFDETNPPIPDPAPQIPLTSPASPVKIPAETSSMLNSRCALAFLFFSIFFFIAGCDKEENAADQRVSQNIQDARETYYKKDGGPEKSHKLLEAAAKEATASSASRATAKALVGQSNYAMAVSQLPGLNTAENEALRMVREINRIGSELGDEVFLIDSLRGSNPSAAAADPIKALSANKAKFAGQVAELDKTIKQLEAKRQELTSKIASLDTEQKSKIEMGNQLLAKSEAAKGQESVDLFKQSAEVRKAAGMLAHELEFARVDLARTEGLIADAQRERKVADESAAIAQNQIQQLNQGWAATEDAIKKRQAQASELLTRAEVDASTKKGIVAESGIAALAKQFAAAKQRAADMRKTIDENNLDASIAAYDEADKFAKKLGEEMKTNLREPKNMDTPVRTAWTRIDKLYNAATFRLGKARSLQLRGQLFLQEKNLLRSQQNLVTALAPMFQKSGLTMPAEIAPADLNAQLDTAHKNALRDLSDSYQLLKDILELDDVQRNNWPQANEARELSVTVEYALHHLEPDKGHLDSAKSTVKLLSDAGANFPALPPDLETRQINPVPIVAGGKGGTTQPTTNPAEAGGTGGPPITPEAAAALKALLRGGKGGASPPDGGKAPPPPAPQQNQ